jgi:hypothetical protein
MTREVLKPLMFSLAVLVLAAVSFFAGCIMPLGIAFLVFTVPGAVVISSIGIYSSFKSGRFQVHSLALAAIILAAVTGWGADNFQTQETKALILDIKLKALDYRLKYKSLPKEEDLVRINPVFKGFKIQAHDDEKFVIFFRDAVLSSEGDSVEFRPRP